MGRLRSWLFRSRLKEELDQELQHHLDRLTELYREQGMPEQEARRAARRDLGNQTRIQEDHYWMTTVVFFETLARDVRYALRGLRRNPGFTFVAVLTLGLGIGATTTLFSIVDGVLLKPLPYPDAARIVEIEESYAGSPSLISSPQKFNFWRHHSGAFEDVTAHWVDHLNLHGGSATELAPVGLVTGNFFDLYGARFVLGRPFDATEDAPDGPNVTILTNDLWRLFFSSDPEIIGKSILIGDAPYTVIGVLAPFPMNLFPEHPELLIPFRIYPNDLAKDSRLCYVTARLKPGVELAEAQSQLRVMAGNYRQAYPESIREEDSFTAEPLQEALNGDLRPMLLILAGAVGLVLLITCANASNLLLVRGEARKRELAIRAAIGAGGMRIVRQLLTESLALAMAGAVFGLGFGWAAVRAFTVLPQTPLGAGASVTLGSVLAANGVNLDWRMLCFTTLIALATAMAAGIVPALRGCGSHSSDALREGASWTTSSRALTRAMSLMIAIEMTLSVVLLVGAGLLLRTSAALRSVDPGFDSANLITMQTSLAGARIESDVNQLVRNGIRQISNIPGVAVAAAACCLPLETAWQLPYIVQGRPLDGRFHGFAGWTFVSPGYFEALHIPVRRGRSFTEHDTMKSPGAVVINETLARRIWPDFRSVRYASCPTLRTSRSS